MIKFKYFHNIYSPKLGLIRSLFALGTLITMCFTSFKDMLPYEGWLTKKNTAKSFSEKYNLFYIGDYHAAEVIYYCSIVILVLIIVGYLPQITSIFYCWITYSLFYGCLIIEGGDQITAILSLLLLPIYIADPRLNHWHTKGSIKKRENKYLKYFLFTSVCFAQIQIAALYLDAGVEKCKVDQWTDGSAIYYWTQDAIFGATGLTDSVMDLIFQNRFLTFIFNWGVILLEFSLFAALFMDSKIKRPLFIIALFFHFFIFLVHGLPSFSIAMTACLLLLFYPHLGRVFGLVRIFI